MKNLLLLFIFISGFSYSQTPTEIHLKFGKYTNDHTQREFHVQEQNWILKDGKLSYKIQVHDDLYADTHSLTELELKTVSLYLDSMNLSDTVTQKFDVDYLDKHEYEQVIFGDIIYKGKNSHILIKGNDFIGMEKNTNCSALYRLEQYFFTIIENHR